MLKLKHSQISKVNHTVPNSFFQVIGQLTYYIL